MTAPQIRKIKNQHQRLFLCVFCFHTNTTVFAQWNIKTIMYVRMLTKGCFKQLNYFTWSCTITENSSSVTNTTCLVYDSFQDEDLETGQQKQATPNCLQLYVTALWKMAEVLACNTRLSENIFREHFFSNCDYLIYNIDLQRLGIYSFVIIL